MDPAVLRRSESQAGTTTSSSTVFPVFGRQDAQQAVVPSIFIFYFAWRDGSDMDVHHVIAKRGVSGV